MPRALDIASALRLVAVCLLLGMVLFGPAGLGSLDAFAAMMKTCGVSCPCDEAAHEVGHEAAHEVGHEAVHDCHADEHAESAHAEHCSDTECADDVGCGDPAHQKDGEPCQDECPEDCSNCGCCVGVSMAVISLPVTSSVTRYTAARMLAPIGVPARGAGAGVFRPPRSLT